MTIHDLVEQIRHLLARRTDERELDEELAFHLEMEQQARIRSGLNPAEARRTSRIALGGIDRTKEDVRQAFGTQWVEHLAGDVAFGVRMLRRSPGFTIVAVLTLAVGLGATTAVFSAVNAVLLRPLPYGQPGQLVRLYQNSIKDPYDRGFVTPVHYLAYKDRMSAFASIAALGTYNPTGADLAVGGGVERIRVFRVSSGYFDVLRSPPALGRGFNASDDFGARSIVLSHRLWTERFNGDTSIVGRAVSLGGDPYVVTGVMPARFHDTITPDADAWTAIDLSEGRDAKNANNHYLGAVARLRPGTTLAQAQAELDALNDQLDRQYPNAKDAHATLYPLKDDVVGTSGHALELMLGAAAAVLILVCVNLANLLLVRGSERKREFALRSALGAERTRLVRQMLVESVVLALAGDVLALVVARLAMAGIVASAGGGIPRLDGLSIDARVLGFSMLLATASAIGFGLLPALRAAHADPNAALRGETRSSTGGVAPRRLRNTLVVVQVSLAFVLLVCAGMLIASVQRLNDVDLGINPTNVLTFELHLPDARYDSLARARFYETVAHAIEQQPGVRAAGGISKLPATGPYHQWGAQALTGPLARDEHRGNVLAEERVISGDYLRAVGMRVLEGRALDARDVATAPHRVLISKLLSARLFPGVDPIGQRLNTGNVDCDVIGVVNDVSLDAEGTPDIFIYHAHTQFAGDRNWALTQVVATSGPPEALTSTIRQTIAALDPLLVMYEPGPLADVIGRGDAQRVFVLRLLTTFAAVALGLAALGLFGVLSYGVRLRSREFGIRIALGADYGAIRRSVVSSGMSMTAVGLLLGVGAALVVGRALGALLFEVSPADPRVFAAAALSMLLVAFVAAYVPARRATAIDPRTVLQ